MSEYYVEYVFSIISRESRFHEVVHIHLNVVDESGILQQSLVLFQKQRIVDSIVIVTNDVVHSIGDLLQIINTIVPFVPSIVSESLNSLILLFCNEPIHL